MASSSPNTLERKEAEPAEQGGDNFRTGSALANRLVLRYERFANNSAYVVGLRCLP